MAAGVPLEQGHLPAGARQPPRCPRGVPGPLGGPGCCGGWSSVSPRGRRGTDGGGWQEIPAAPPRPRQAQQRGACSRGGRGPAGGASEGHTGHCSSGTGRKFSWARGVTLLGSGPGLRVGPRSRQRGSGWEWVKRSARWLSCMCRRWGRHQGGSLALWLWRGTCLKLFGSPKLLQILILSSLRALLAGCALAVTWKDISHVVWCLAVPASTPWCFPFACTAPFTTNSPPIS